MRLAGRPTARPSPTTSRDAPSRPADGAPERRDWADGPALALGHPRHRQARRVASRRLGSQLPSLAHTLPGQCPAGTGGGSHRGKDLLSLDGTSVHVRTDLSAALTARVGSRPAPLSLSQHLQGTCCQQGRTSSAPRRALGRKLLSGQAELLLRAPLPGDRQQLYNRPRAPERSRALARWRARSGRPVGRSACPRDRPSSKQQKLPRPPPPLCPGGYVATPPLSLRASRSVGAAAWPSSGRPS
jgi:hypothetical protein